MWGLLEFVRGEMERHMDVISDLGIPRWRGTTANFRVRYINDKISRVLEQPGQEDCNTDGTRLTFNQFVSEILLYWLIHSYCTNPQMVLSLDVQVPPFAPSDQLMIQELKD